MKAEIQAKIDLMVDNFHTLDKGFIWDMPIAKHFGAMIGANRESHITVEQVKTAKKLIERDTSMWSYFRGTNEFLLAVLLTAEANPDDVLNRCIEHYEALKQRKFYSSAYLVLAAYSLAKHSDPYQYNRIYDRFEAFYAGMKANHFWLTGDNDYVYAAILAMSDFSVEATIDKTEAIYQCLKSMGLSAGNELQNLSHILAFGEGSAESDCNRAMALYAALKQRKCKIGSYGLALVGVLSLIMTSEDSMADEVAEVYDHLKQLKGYGAWSLGHTERAILAASIVADYYNDKISSGTVESTLASSVNSIIIAQQAATMAAISGAAAASAAASSGN